MERKFKKRHKLRSPEVPPTKQEMEIMKYVRFKTPKKSTVIDKQEVEYFIGSKAVDVLMDSKWSKEIRNTDFLFPTREQATKFFNEQLHKRFFYRAMKNEKKKNDETKDQSGDNQDKSDSQVRRRKKGKAAEEGSNDTPQAEENDAKEIKEKTKEKVKKRYKLTIHDEQKFRDSKDIYIWIYNPIHPKTVLLGLVVLLAVVAATLFPLWPPVVRIGVYYLSLAGGIFIGSIFAIAFARSVLFAVIWMCTLGKHHFWILPNILADVGFFDSFKPWYTHEYKGGSEKKKEDDNVKEEDAAKEEEENQEKEKVEEKEDNYNEEYEVLGETDEKTAESENSATEGEVSSSDPTANP